MEALAVNIFSTLAPVRSSVLKPIVGAVTDDGGWLRRPTWYEFETPAGRIHMTVTGEEYWTGQRAGLKGYASKFLASKSETLTQFSSMVDQFASAYALHGDIAIEPGDATFTLIERIAQKIGGVVFADGGIFLPGRGLLFGPGAEPAAQFGLTATEEQLKGAVRTSLDHPAPSERQLKRREKSGVAVRALGLPVLESLPVIEDDSETEPQDVPSVVRRMLCIAVCAVKAEKAEREFIEQLIDRYQIREWLSPQELSFLAEDKPSDRQMAKFGWRYECAHVLQWYLGYEPDLRPAHEHCDAKTVVGHLVDKSTGTLVEQAMPRSVAEVLDMADLYYRLHWATIDLRLKQKRSPNADGEIVMERHYALNWLIRYQDAGWDDVQTDT